MLEKFKNIADQMWSIAGNLQDKGINRYIPFIKEDGDVLHAMKSEMLLILFAIIGEVPSAVQVKFVQQVFNVSVNEENREAFFEYVCCMGEENYNSLLPYFYVMDKYSKTELAEAYLNFIATMVTGCMKYSNSINIVKLQRYQAIMISGKQLVEKGLGWEISFEPLSYWENDTRQDMELFYEEQENQSEESGLYQVILQTLDKDIQEVEGKTVFEEYIKSLNSGIIEGIRERMNHIDDGGLSDNKERTSQFMEEAKKELNRLVGLTEVKWQVASMINLAKIRQECKKRGINRQSISYHMIFVGNPGTGKTTVARLMAEVYHSLGILSKGHLVEVSRSDLVGEYVGHTAVKVQKVLKNAKGGILFIDEAYSLVHTNANRNDFGYEAIATLMKGMEDNRDDMVVIAAGYPELMANFLDSNPGLVSRFAKTIYFPDYNVEELGLIFSKMCEDNSIQYENSVMERVLGYFDKEASLKTANFGNARMVRNFFEAILLNQANRLVLEGEITDSMLQRIVLEDIPVKKYIDKK